MFRVQLCCIAQPLTKPLCRVTQCRLYGAPRHKPNMHKGPRNAPTKMAMDFFDFYYGQMFKDRWPSIRLGLLTPKKHVAILNNFSTSFEAHRERIEEMGTLELTETIKESWERALQRREARRKGKEQPAEPTYLELNNKSFSPWGEEHVEDKELANQEENQEGKKETRMDQKTILRGNSFEPSTSDIGKEMPDLDAFVQPSREFTMYAMNTTEHPNYTESELRAEAKRRILERDFQITGLEGLNSEPMNVVDDATDFPANLKLMVYPKGSLDDFPSPIPDSRGLSGWWLVDGGSVLPVFALDLKETDAVLDMCAAPGGKSLMIIQTRKFASLVSNDNKLHRLGQLRRALSMYIPNDCIEAKKVILKRKDVASVHNWDELELYDKVLLDAPCLTDRLSANQDEFNIFHQDYRTTRLDLPQTQTKMLVNAIRSVKVGGSIVYSTCTLSPNQNELVVDNAVALAKSYYGIECVEKSLDGMKKKFGSTGLYRFSDECKRGITLVPWIISNFGPMYICKLERIK